MTPGIAMDEYPKLAAVVLILLLIVGLYAPAVVAQQAQEVVFEDVFTGIAAPQASGPIRNIGQVMHLIQVSFPAETVSVDPIQVRLEISYDQVTWFPIMYDITNAPVLDNGIPGVTDVIAYQEAYGAWRVLRVNSLLATPGGELMNVRYYGHLIPVVPFVTLESDRWTF